MKFKKQFTPPRSGILDSSGLKSDWKSLDPLKQKYSPKVYYLESRQVARACFTSLN